MNLVKNRVLASILIVLLIGCSSKKNDFDRAATLHYYCSFVDEVNTDFSKKIIEQITKNIYDNSYVITNQSGINWPYFKRVDEPANFPADSVLLPHPGLHKFHQFKAYQPNESSQFKVLTTIVSATEQEVELNETVYQKGSDGNWEVLVDVGIMKLPRSSEMDEQSFIHFIKEQLILITFK